MRLTPPQPISPLLGTIVIAGNAIRTRFAERHNAFVDTVRSLGYSWEIAYWERQINQFNGPLLDRAVELGVHLLARGFILDVPDDLGAAIIAGEYAPEQTRWIRRCVAGQYTGWFQISWSRRDDMYRVAKRIYGARYSKPHIVVPAESYDEVLDFAEQYHFALSEGAKNLAEEAKAKARAAVVVEAKPISVSPPPRRDPSIVPDIVEIDDELADEPL